MKIGIYGGSFDPLHNGHIFLAKSALKELELDLIQFVLCGKSPYKNKIIKSDWKIRLMMLNLGLPIKYNITVNMYEATMYILSGKTSYTIDTVKDFKLRHPKDKGCLLLGPDAKECFEEFKDYKEILKLVDVKFAGYDFMRENVIIRSSMIRKMVKKGLSISKLVPQEVEEYIIGSKLYKEVV